MPTITERQKADQRRAKTALRRGKQTTTEAVRGELEHAYERIKNGPEADRPVWEQVAYDLERVLAHRGGSAPAMTADVIPFLGSEGMRDEHSR